MTKINKDKIIHGKMTKTALAESLGISRQALYYQHKKPVKDQLVKKEIEKVLINHSAYGHKRIAMELKMNKKKIRRVMKIFNIKPYKRRIKHPFKTDDLNRLPAIYKNKIKNICPIKPNVIWAGDFTFIKFHQLFIYLATIIDVFTREIIGWSISTKHDRFMVLDTLKMAKSKTGAIPIYHHSDQGSEYDSCDYLNLLKKDKITISMSAKGHPWENGFQESFYSHFKLDLGWANQFETLPELIEAIHLQIHYYNTKRIHTKLKTQPQTFKRNYYLKILTINQPQRYRMFV